MVGLAARLLPYALAFFSSLCIMILELDSSRLVAMHVGSSLTVWTSVIGIILGGICLGNVLGGRLADRVEPRRAVGPLFALGSLLVLCCLWINAEVGHIIPAPETINWELRTVIVVILDFLVPATVLGMVGPVVAKMAVEQAQRTGSAIGDVYFCGAIGSIAGTFLAGFVLMYLAQSSTIVLLVAAALALLAAALFGQVGGLVLGLLTALCLAWDRSIHWSGRSAWGPSLLVRTRSTSWRWPATSRPSCSVSWVSPACSRHGGSTRLWVRRPTRASAQSIRTRRGPACPTWRSWRFWPALASWLWRWWPGGWCRATWGRASTAGPASSPFCLPD